MSAPEHEPPLPLAAAPDPQPLLRELPQWPVTRLAAFSLTVVLLLAVLVPPLLITGGGPSLVALLLPAAMSTAVARVLFESLAPGRRRQLRGHLLPAAGGALPATVVQSVATLVVGVPWPPAAAAATAAMAFAALLGAGVTRDVEIRWRMSMRRVYFAGAPAARADLERELARRSYATFVGSSTFQPPLNPAHLVSAVQVAAATVLVLDREAMAAPELVEAAAELHALGVRVLDLVGYYEAEFKKVPLGELTPTWFLFDVAGGHRYRLGRILWRALELVVAAAGLLLSLPVMVLVAVAIRLTSPGPALYRQRRVGRGGAHFTLRKLRTMTTDESDDGTGWAGSHAHRITPIGRVLRRLRLDELPQLWNVLCGELALVGPRPEQVPIAQRLEREIPFYAARHSVRPGLTGWAQVNLGYAGSVEGTMAKLQRDLYYVKHNGWRLDCLILWLTLKAILHGPAD